MTKLVNNNATMIRFSTVDALCYYFKITPKDLFVYYPDNSPNYNDNEKLVNDLLSLRSVIDELIEQKKLTTVAPEVSHDKIMQAHCNRLRLKNEIY